MVSQVSVRVVLLSSIAAYAAGCGASTASRPGETDSALALTSVSPAAIKANFDGRLLLTGAGFVEGATVLVEGAPASSIGASVEVVDEWTIALEIDYAGQPLEAGDYHIEVEVGSDRSDSKTVHVRPILFELQHVRTLPGVFHRDGGFLDMWVMPDDSQNALIRPGHELAGAGGLGDANFRWDNVTLTRIGTTMPVAPDTAGVADVYFEPVGTMNPLSVVLTIDQSGSMIGLGVNPVPSDPNDERVNQSQAFVDRMGAMDEASVYRFQGEAGAVFPVIGFSSDKTALKDALDTLRETEGGNTPLYDAMIESVEALASKSGKTRAAIVLTDGRDTTSGATAADAINAARAVNVPIYAIGLGNPNDANSLDKEALQNIADQTGGRVFFAEDANALEGIFDQLTALLADSYRLESALQIDPPLTASGSYRIEGDITAEVDGESITIPMPAFNVSVLD